MDPIDVNQAIAYYSIKALHGKAILLPVALLCQQLGAIHTHTYIQGVKIA